MFCPARADTEEKLTARREMRLQRRCAHSAAEAFAKKAGVSVRISRKLPTPRRICWSDREAAGRAASELLAADCRRKCSRFRGAKTCIGARGKRTVCETGAVGVRCWIAAVVPVEIAGITAGNASRGHPCCMLCAGRLLIRRRVTLRHSAGFVKVDVASAGISFARRWTNTRTVRGCALAGGRAVIETVVHLTEWPTVRDRRIRSRVPEAARRCWSR